MLLAFLVMLSFGLGCALPLVTIGYASGLELKKIGKVRNMTSTFLQLL